MTVANSMTKAKRLERDLKLDDAAKIYGDILARYPQNIKARSALDTLRSRMRNIDDPPSEVINQIRTDLTQGNVARAASTCASNLNSYRKSHFLWQTLGQCHLQRNNLNEAATCLNKAMELNSQQAETYVLMASVCAAQGQSSNAVALLRKALQVQPEHLGALNDLGNLMLRSGNPAEALVHLKAASDLAPDNAGVLFNYAAALRETGQLDAAQRIYETMVKFDSSLRAAHFNLGQLHILQGRNDDALPCFERAITAKVNCDRSRTSKLHAMAHLSKWEWLDEYAEHRRYLGLQGTACSPFQLMAMEDNPDLLRIRTQAYAGETAQTPMTLMRQAPTVRPSRIKIGYFSSDFHNHATMHLMGGLFALHDRERFETFAYSFGPNRDDTGRSQVINHVDHFVEAAGMSNVQLTERALSDNLDIVVDLKGYTGGNRHAMFARRLAPIQISYLGYPGTMGSGAYDYMIADWQVCPMGSERYYDENLIRMPHSYQINDSDRAISDQQMSRTDCGLPEQGFVFCCFNNSYKITPSEFDIWMRLLDHVDGSVLWLLDTGDTSKENLRREAKARGIAPNRIIFAPRMDQQEHLARHRLADLFLDTFIVNAHTTASDALWAGLPVLTLAGKQFAARVSASLLSAVGLPELITDTPKAYEELALAIATNPQKLKDLKSRLMENRSTAPLFDTKDFVRDLELAYDLSFARWQTGQAPDHINVSSAAADGAPGTTAVA